MELVLDRRIYVTKLNYSVLLFSGLNVVFQQIKPSFSKYSKFVCARARKASKGVEVELV